MEYTVSLDVDTAVPLTMGQLERIAAIGGACSGEAGGRRYGTTLTVEATDLTAAVERAQATATSICPGQAVSVEAMSSTEFDLRLGFPA